MLIALEAARSKLSHYYAQTDHIPGDLYAIGTIIAPENKLHYFTRKEWKDPKKNWCKTYRESLERLFQPYEERLASQSPSNIQSSASQDDELGFLLNSSQPQESFLSHNDELARYLGSSPLPTAPRVFWKDHEHEFPALASLARDVLSIPATGAGVERLFNSARDVCHYRCGFLNASTIQERMMYMCATKFEVEETQLAYLQEFRTRQKQEAAEEERDARQTQDSVDPISIMRRIACLLMCNL